MPVGCVPGSLASPGFSQSFAGLERDLTGPWPQTCRAREKGALSHPHWEVRPPQTMLGLTTLKNTNVHFLGTSLMCLLVLLTCDLFISAVLWASSGFPPKGVTKFQYHHFSHAIASELTKLFTAVLMCDF